MSAAVKEEIRDEDGHGGPAAGVTLYYNKFSSPSRKALIALYEKNVQFTPHHIDLLNREQHQKWYLLINPRGEVPVLKHGDKIVTESTKIIEYIGANFGGGGVDTLFPGYSSVMVNNMVKKVDAVPISPLTYGCVLYHAEHVTSTLRHPYSDQSIQDQYRKLIVQMPETLSQRSQEIDSEPGLETACKVLAEKAILSTKVWPVLQDLDLYKATLAQAISLLDEVERELGSDDHLGPWLCGPTFTAADVAFTCFLFRLYQLGLDDKYWEGGVRPSIKVYADIAFKRPSVEKATEFSLHKHKYLAIAQTGDVQLNSAYLGLGAALALGAVYAYKKLRRN